MPEKSAIAKHAHEQVLRCKDAAIAQLRQDQLALQAYVQDMRRVVTSTIDRAQAEVSTLQELVKAYDPTAVLRRGYSLIKKQGTVVKSVHDVKTGDPVSLQLHDGSVDAQIT